MKTIGQYLEERGVTAAQLAADALMEIERVKAIVSGNYTPGPSDRLKLAAALGISIDEVSWGHAVPVEHLRGNGPQSGRST